MGGSKAETGDLDPLKNHKNIVFLSNTGPSYQANVQFWAIIDDKPLIVVFGSDLPSSTHKKIIN